MNESKYTVCHPVDMQHRFCFSTGWVLSPVETSIPSEFLGRCDGHQCFLSLVCNLML